jgi:hypothetical protein
MSNDEPSKWNEMTDPFDVVRYFARQDVKDAQITKLMSRNSIYTLEELRIQSANLLSILQPNSLFDLTDAVRDALDRNKKTLEEILGGQLIYDQSCIENSSYAYVQEAVSVNSTTVPERGNSFTLVLGPSGSGKTYFALWWLTDHLYRHTTKTDVLTIHFKASKVVRLLEKESLPGFAEAVAALVDRQIQMKLSEFRVAKNNKHVNLYLHVIIDDAGGEKFKDYFQASYHMSLIISAVERKVSFTFLKSVHLTVVGSCLETQTDYGGSVVEHTEYYMQPWKLEHLNYMVNASSSTGQQQVKAAVNHCPILQSLISNARCASYVLSVMDQPLLRGADAKNSSNIVVLSVPEKYIASTGLKKLKSAADKWAAARSVLSEITKAATNPKEAFFPKCDELKTEELRSTAISLLDVHVTASQTDGIRFIGDRRISVTISPAVALVLVTLLNEKASFSWDWQAFESTVAMCEWQRMVAHSNSGTPSHADRTILDLPSPFPYVVVDADEEGDIEFTVPMFSRFTVVSNTWNTAYADVVAPFRLVQARYSATGAAQYLDLFEELSQLGLTRDPNWQLQQAVTSVLFRMWDKDLGTPSTNKVEIARTGDNQNGYCVFNSMVNRWIHERPAELVCRVKQGSDSVKVVGDVTQFEVKVLEAFDEEHPVSAVFVTNSKQFDVTVGTGPISNTTMQVGREDVDWEGKLTRKVLPDDLVSSLRENVEIRFMFC